MLQTRVRLAIQKSGRLNEGSIDLLVECGIKFSINRGSSKLIAEASNFPLEILFLRDDDIPGYVEDKVADIGIVGENVMHESGKNIESIEQLGFSHCRLSIAVPKTSTISSVSDLKGCNIATSYPRILSSYLKEKNVDSYIHEISGSVEIAPSIGLADAICDIVGSGSTLISNGLREIEKILDSQAVLIARKDIFKADKDYQEKIGIIEKLLFRIRSVIRARNYKYILLNAPNNCIDKIVGILPGIKSPTIVPLGINGWSSIHSVVEENEFWEIIENLRIAGAEGILVLPIEKMIY